MGRKSSITKIEYSDPVPFALPTLWDTNKNIFAATANLVPRETLHYSSKTLEEIMFYLNREYDLRERTKPIWKMYNSSLADYEVFKPNPQTGEHISKVAVKWLPQYVLDIQAAIDDLIDDDIVHDTRAAYLARVFCNRTPPIMETDWVSNNKLKDGIRVPFGGDGNVNHVLTINPLSAAKNGQWPFDETYLKNCLAWVGITPSGIAQSTITSTDPSCPKSPISDPDANGKIGGLSTTMTAANRPTSNRKIVSGTGQGNPDYDEGYGYLAHLALVLQQLRYQPPVIEHWPIDVPRRHYVSNIYSNTTPNKAWFFAQPVENFQMQNWGFWLMGGMAGVTKNQLYLKTYDDPIVQHGEQGSCTYAVFFPGSNIGCHCGYTSYAWAIWWSNEAAVEELQYDKLPILTTGTAKQGMKLFGPHTKLKMSVNFNVSGGSNVTKTEFLVQVKTARIGAGFNPWTKVISKIGNYSGEIEINLMEYLHNNLNNYSATGVDAIIALSIGVQSSTQASWTVTPLDTPTGSVVPPGANSMVRCISPTCTLTVDYVSLEEAPIVGDPVDDYV